MQDIWHKSTDKKHLEYKEENKDEKEKQKPKIMVTKRGSLENTVSVGKGAYEL